MGDGGRQTDRHRQIEEEKESWNVEKRTCKTQKDIDTKENNINYQKEKEKHP